MKQFSRSVVLCAVAMLCGSLAVVAGSYTVHVEDGATFETRYPPRFGEQDVQFLTRTGHWVTLAKEAVMQVTNGSSDGNHVRMIDSKTILIGWAPNDKPHSSPTSYSAPSETPGNSPPVDPVILLLGYVAARDSRPRQDFSVPQFVDTEDMVGGIPASGIYYFKVAEQEPLENLLGLPPGSLRAIQGLPPDPGLQETLQGLPPGGFRALQGLPPAPGFQPIPQAPSSMGPQAIQGQPPPG